MEQMEQTENKQLSPRTSPSIDAEIPSPAEQWVILERRSRQQLFWSRLCAALLVLLLAGLAGALWVLLPKFNTLYNQVQQLMPMVEDLTRQAQDALDKLDVDAINKAVQSLQSVVEPLSEVMNRFGGLFG